MLVNISFSDIKYNYVTSTTRYLFLTSINKMLVAEDF